MVTTGNSLVLSEASASSGSGLLHRNGDPSEIHRRGSVVTRRYDDLHLSSAQLFSKRPLVLVVVIRRRHRDSQFQRVGSGRHIVEAERAVGLDVGAEPANP